MTDVDIAVIGAGPAGCAAATALAEGGRDVLLLERRRDAGETVCGEFLGADAVVALARLGLSPAALGAVPVHRMRFAAGGHTTTTPLPFASWALPRAVLDAALRARAVAAGASLHAGCAVLGAEPDRGGWRLRLRDGALRANTVVLATGKYALRGHPRRDAPPGWVGLKLHLDGVDCAGDVGVLLFHGGYAGLQPLPDGGANLCAAMRYSPPADAAGLLARVAAGSSLGVAMLATARPRWPKPLAVAAVPYGFRHRSAVDDPPGLYRVGDQAAVIPSFTGDGVALALHSGMAAAAAILRAHDAERFHADWRRRTAAPLRWAAVASWVMRRAPVPAVWASTVLARPVARRTRVAPA